MNNYEKLEDMAAATFTPSDENGGVNLSVIDKYTDWIASTPIKGAFVRGITGEFSSLAIDERKLILEKWFISARKRFKVIAHVGSNCQRSAVELVRHAAQVGANAITSIAPSFFKPGAADELVDFFTPIYHFAVGLPFYYYSMPSITEINLSVDKFLVEGKRKIPNLVGTKFTHNNPMEMGVCIELEQHWSEVLHGYDEILVSGLAMEAIAGVGSTYNYTPNVYQVIFDSMKMNDLEAVRYNQIKSICTVEVIIKYDGGVCSGKAIMKLIGIDCGSCRLPIEPFSVDEYEKLRGDLGAIKFFEF